MISHLLRQQVEQRKQDGLYRQRTVLKPGLCFASNDYLGLGNDVRVRRAYQRGFDLYAAGSGGSALVSGYHPIHRQLEKTIAERLGVDDAVLFSSGYAANLGIVSMLATLDRSFLIDKAVHASVYDALKLADAKYTRFKHHDMEDLRLKMSANCLLITEGIFSMSGHSSNLQDIVAICTDNQSACVIDESHSFGVIGPSGLGLVAHYQMSQEEVPLRMIAFGKAMGGQGAVVAGRGEWIEALCQSARSYIYSTAISPAITYGLSESFNLLCDASDARRSLQQIIACFQEAVSQQPLTFRSSSTAIQQLQLGCPKKAMRLMMALDERGIVCKAMREPTVTRKETGLRVVLNAHHTPEDIDRFFSVIQELGVQDWT